MTALAPGRSACIVGASAVGAFGADWKGLDAALEAPQSFRCRALDLEPLENREAVRARKLMSRGARLGALAMTRALADAGWTEHHEEIGAFFGVGASGGSMEELEAMLRKSAGPHGFSTEAFGGPGLLACNPLLAFQLMNNFTLCHGAILNGTGGPNAAFFSRGGGTAFALAEAIHALAETDATRVLAGAADTALHPVTRDELEREGWLNRGVVPAEGAAVLALAASGGPRITDVSLSSLEALATRDAADVVVTVGSTDELRGSLAKAFAGAIDVSGLGESLAATPALAWVVAYRLISTGRAKSVHVVTAGVDGEVTSVRLEGAA